MDQQSTIGQQKQDSGFLELESMASMRRLGEQSAQAFFARGSTLADLDGISAQLARKAAGEHRENIAHGQHDSERYKVLGEIARGGMGAILDVHDSDLDRNVAMKVLLRDTREQKTPSGSPMESGPVHRFIAEAQLTGSLEHPNIVPVHELGLDAQGRVYFTMKRVRGRSLRQVMDKLRQGDEATLAEFTQGRLLSILLKVCDAVDFAHSRGIIHRDIKPENIMVGQFGEVLVMDWGLAKQVEAAAAAAPETGEKVYQLEVSLGNPDGDTTHTREGTISGTPAYMAPEQARGAVAEIDRRTDVFCLGGVLYEMLCLVPPYIAPTASESLEVARQRKLLSPRDKLEAVLREPQLKRAFGPGGIARGRKFPRELVSVAMRAMHIRRESRYATVGELKHDVENFLSALPVSAHRDSPWSRLGKWSRRNPTRAAAITIGLVALLLGGVVFSAIQARFAQDKLGLAEETARAEAGARKEADKRLDAEAEARKQAEQARVEAERAARLEQEKLERERREAEALAARQAAFVPYSQAADLRTRSATFEDWAEKAKAWASAANLYRRALQLDDRFVEAHLELAGIYADLGFDDDALFHFARADALTSVQTGRGHVEALMAYAMYDFQRKVLREGLSANFDEVFRRFGPVRDAAESGSNFAVIAQVLVDLGEAWRSSNSLDLTRVWSDATQRLAMVEGERVPLWEVYTLLAILDESAQLRGSDEEENYLDRAKALKANVPLLTWLDVRQIGGSIEAREKEGLRRWDDFCYRFPYDPRGLYSRALLRFQSTHVEDTDAELKDLNAAITLNPRYADAHKLILRILVREGDTAGAIAHIDAMRKSQSGLSNEDIDLIEVELTASTGEYARLNSLVLAALNESAPHGQRSLAQAAVVLLRDNEFAALAQLCDAITGRMQAASPPIAFLFKGRALTMLREFDEALRLLRPLEDAPLQVAEEFRPLLRDWADDARRYPDLLQGHSVPPVRHRLDIGRILATSGAEPQLWMELLNTTGMRRQDILEYGTPADLVLRAIGYARRARSATRREDQLNERDKAVASLVQALDDGYLNRVRIRRDEYLSSLVADPKIARYFPAR